MEAQTWNCPHCGKQIGTFTLIPPTTNVIVPTTAANPMPIWHPLPPTTATQGQ